MAINPATPVSAVECVLDYVDMVLVMSVNPGFGGQAFIPYTLAKVEQLRGMARERGLDLDIEVDGGVSPSNSRLLINAGANVLVAGSAVFKADRPAYAVELMRGSTDD